MDDLAARMCRITEELNKLQRTLQEALVEGNPSSLSELRVKLEAVKDFKSAIDQMRHFLWFYVQAVSNDCGGEKLIELLRRASRGDDYDARAALEQMKALSDFAILHYPLAPNRKPN